MTRTPEIGRCERCGQNRHLFPYTYDSPDSQRKETVQLCLPCHSRSATENDPGRLEEDIWFAMS